MSPFESFVPEHLKPALQRYIEDGIIPGQFLFVVLTNDLAEACGHADPISGRYLTNIVSWLYNEAPGVCWGSREKVERWSASLKHKRGGEA